MKKITVLLAVMVMSAAGWAQPISAPEASTLLRLYEEERLAKEVYAMLDKTWNKQVFKNIGAAEENHLQRVRTVIIHFELESSLPQNQPGLFSDPRFQELYNDLTTRGRLSLEEALKAGARIEESDIADLELALAATTDASLRETYRYLVAASENHLRAFVRNLRRNGVVYQPVVLDQQRYRKIITAGNAQPGRPW